MEGWRKMRKEEEETQCIILASKLSNKEKVNGKRRCNKMDEKERGNCRQKGREEIVGKR